MYHPLSTRVYVVRSATHEMRRRPLALSKVLTPLRVYLLTSVIVHRLNNLCLLLYRKCLVWLTSVLLVRWLTNMVRVLIRRKVTVCDLVLNLLI